MLVKYNLFKHEIIFEEERQKPYKTRHTLITYELACFIMLITLLSTININRTCLPNDMIFILNELPKDFF